MTDSKTTAADAGESAWNLACGVASKINELGQLREYAPRRDMAVIKLQSEIEKDLQSLEGLVATIKVSPTLATVANKASKSYETLCKAHRDAYDGQLQHPVANPPPFNQP